MSSYRDFFPEVLPYVRDVSDPVAEAAIRNACIDFCERSNWWQIEHADIAVLPGTADYTLTLPTGASMARIMQARLDEGKLAPTTPDQLREFYGANWRTLTGQPYYITHLTSAAATLVSVPTEAATLKLIVALRPARASTTVDDDIFERWAPAIGIGAQSHLYAQPAAPYYDPNAASQCAIRFRAECHRAASERMRAQGRIVQVLRPPRFV